MSLVRRLILIQQILYSYCSAFPYLLLLPYFNGTEAGGQIQMVVVEVGLAELVWEEVGQDPEVEALLM